MSAIDDTLTTIIEAVDRFEVECEAEDHTGTGDAWTLLELVRVQARHLLDRENLPSRRLYCEIPTLSDTTVSVERTGQIVTILGHGRLDPENAQRVATSLAAAAYDAIWRWGS